MGAVPVPVPTFPHLLAPDYKANRPSLAERRRRQRELAKEASDSPLNWLMPLGRRLEDADPPTPSAGTSPG